MTIDQDWARKRNWAKFKLSGIFFLINQEVLTDEEKNELKYLRQRLKTLLSSWNKNNKISKESYRSFYVRPNIGN